MNPVRYFPLQTTRIPSNDGIPGGIPQITPELAAFYCQGMPKTYYYAGRLKWALDETVEYYLEIRLWMKAHDMIKKWNLPEKRIKDGTLRELARTVILETKNPSKLRHDEVKAARLGVHRNTFRNTLKTPYEDLFNIFNEWANCATRHIYKQIAKEDLNLT